MLYVSITVVYISRPPVTFFEVVMPFWLIFKGFKPEVYR